MHDAAKVFVVLGMHRSATSLIAKGLHEAGVHMGDSLLEASSSNPWGHYEDRDLIAANDQLLRMADGTWAAPPDRAAIELLAADPRAVEIVESYVSRRSGRGVALWGMKDPRTVLTWPLWRQHLDPSALHVIHVWRDAHEVAASLHARDGHPIEACLSLAEHYHALMRAYVAEEVTAHA